MSNPHLLGVVLAVASAAVWGSGDFSGGLATRRGNALQVLALSTLSGIGLLAAGVFLRQEPLPGPADILWAALAGAASIVGLAALYRGLSQGLAAAVAPVSGVIAAALPVIVNLFTVGAPPPLRMAGLVLALPGIGLVSAAEPGSRRAGWQGLGLALLAGAGFGAFFVLVSRAEAQAVFMPLVVARSLSFVVCAAALLVRRLPAPRPQEHPVALIAGLLDAGGNVLYMLARQFTRPDVAAVLASLYPAATVLLSVTLLKQPVTRRQWAGLGLCLGAVALIAI